MRKLIIIAGVFSILTAIYAAAGFYLLPYAVIHKLPELITEKTGQHAEIKAFRCNPFTFEFEMQDFAIEGSDKKHLFGFADLAVNFNAFASLSQRSVVFDDIILRNPITNIKREANGKFNFTMPPSQEKPANPESEKTNAIALVIRHLAIEEGEASWMDASMGQLESESLKPINLAINDLTMEKAGTASFDLSLGLSTGGHLHWQGELGLTPIASKGQITLEELNISKLSEQFLQKILPVQIPDGKLSLKTEYRVSIVNNKQDILINHGDLEIKQLAVAEKSQNTNLLTVPDIALHGISIDVDKQQIGAASFTSNGANIKAWLQKNGRINYQDLLAAQNNIGGDSPATQKPQTVSAESRPWRVNLDDLTLSNYQFQFTDQTQKKPQAVKLSGMNLNLKKLGYPLGEKLPMQFSATFNDEGKIKIDGNTNLAPLSADLVVDVRNIKLKTFQSYIDPFLNLNVVDGAFNTHGNFQLASAEDLQLFFQGEVNIDNLTTRDKANNKDFLKWSNLQLQAIDVDSAKQRFALGKILFDEPYIRVNIQKDKSTNIGKIVVSQPENKNIASQPTPAKKTAAKTEPKISIQKIQFKNGNSDFADNSLILPFVAEMNALNGEIDGFISDQDNPLKLQLQGRAYDLAPVKIDGSYQLKSGDSDIALKFTNMPLPLITPYMADFAGYKIEKGQMTLDLRYKVKHKQLEAQNKIFIDQLTLGDQIENPHATSLPLRLAIALLKDADGKINLDFPLTGSLDDPQFSIGSLVVDVLENLITKLVESPFKALGGLFGSDNDQDANTVNFTPGSSEPSPEASAKLDQLSKALQNKTELALEIKGMAFQTLDWPAMRFDALKEILRKMKSGELRDKGENIRSEYIELPEGEYKRLLEKFFKEVFPQDIEFTMLGKPRVKSQPDAEFYEAARQKLEAVMQPDPQRLNQLAVARASAISKYLTEKCGLDISRIYILAPEIDPPNIPGIVSVLSLNVTH